PSTQAVCPSPVGLALVQAVQAPMLRPLGVGDVLDRTFTVYRSKPLIFIGISAIWYLLLFLVFIVLGAIIFAGSLSAFARQATTPSPEFVAGVIVAIAGTFYLAASWLVAPVIVVVEKLGPIAALGRSWRLSSGSRWRIIGIQALLGILNLVLSLLIGGIFGGLAAAGQTEQPGQ